MANHTKRKNRKQQNESMRTRSNYTHNRHQARENACDQVVLGFGFASDWLSRWHEVFFNQSQSIVKQNQRNSTITFQNRSLDQ